MDFRTARLLGVRANRVIGSAVLISGAARGDVARDPHRPEPARHARLRPAGHDHRARGRRRRRHEPAAPATLGGFAIGFVSGLLGGALPTDQSQYLPSFVFGLVILVLLVRPDGLFARGPGPWSACERPRRDPARRRRGRSSSLAALLGSVASTSTEIYFINALVAVSIVVALYVFVGNSGVLSFGHISFVAVGAWAAGVLSVPVAEKPAMMPYLFPFLARPHGRERPVAPHRRRRRRVYALLVGLAADAAVRARGGHRDVRRARDHPQRAAVLREDRARPPTRSRSVPETTDLLQAPVGAVLAIGVAFAYQAAASAACCARRARTPPPRARSASPSTASGSSRSRCRGARRLRGRPLRPLSADQRPTRCTST